MSDFAPEHVYLCSSIMSLLLENEKRMLRLSLKHHTCVSVSNLIVTFFNKVDMNDHISKGQGHL